MLVTLATSHMFDVDLQLFEAGRLSDMARRVVGDAIAAAHRVVVVAVTHDVTHAAGHTNTNTHTSEHPDITNVLFT